MDAHSLRVLEFSEIIDRLAAEASSVLGRQRAQGLRPSADPDLVARRLAETRECRDLLRLGGMPALQRVTDIREAVQRASIPGVRLSPQELLAIADTLDAALQVRRHLGAAAAFLGRPEEARVSYQEALDMATGLRFRPEIALTRLGLAELLLAHYPDEKAEALEHLDFAVGEFREMKMQPSLERALKDRENLKGQGEATSGGQK